ncbi:hypothetical protein [Nocardia sp. AG03]|uniref:hypothetical protein n=1 Tax=Nocardia sp. AG03 TaxID=3025312 RepID=UPI0024182720|nr:hypothetical protein [Nocardia sp. AG03]
MRDRTRRDDEAREPSSAVTAWTVGLLCVSVVACGVIAGGLLHETEPELTTAPPTSTRVTTEAARPQSYRTPEVVFPVEIPGCDQVEPPGEDGLVGWAGSAESGYDDPDFPWYSGPKATAMSAAARAALPTGVTVDWDSIDRSLVFQPILGEPDDPLGGFARAAAAVRRGERGGSLSLSVRADGWPLPPCRAGDLDERRVLADATVDLHDTWSETDGVRTLSRSATAYFADGGRVSAYVTDAADHDAHPTGAVPIDRDELVALVTAPGLRASTPVPPGSPEPPEACAITVDRSDPISEDAARRLGSALADVALDGHVLDRPLTDLRPPGYDSGGVCQVVRVDTDGLASRLSVSITTGSVPESTDGTVSRTLPDGSVVETRENAYSTWPADGPRAESSRSVTVTRPSGTRIRLSSSAVAPAEPLSLEQLEAIALTPGLEVTP